MAWPVYVCVCARAGLPAERQGAFPTPHTHMTTQLCLFAFCLGASMRVRPNPQHSWLHHLVLVFLTGFAGGACFRPSCAQRA